MHNTSGMKSNTDMSFLSSVRIWLQAEEEDTGLVFFLAGEEEEEGSLRLPPSLSSSSSSSYRKKSVSNVERLIDRSSCSSGGGGRGSGDGDGDGDGRGVRGSSCQPGTDSDGAEHHATTTAVTFDITAPGGFTLPFHLILGVTRGATEKVTKSNPDR